MENNLFDRLTPEAKEIFDKHEASYPAITGEIKRDLKNNWLLINVRYGTVLDLENMIPLGNKLSAYKMFTEL
tara:strand:+ start:557 stop:772 length:216 start_codon:yes stop_codon:yes gene_type:complete